MPLPSDPKAPWPPADIAGYAADQAAWAAWWSGDPDQLTATSAGASQDVGRRTFWQRRRLDSTAATPHLHAPLAADIAATSADILFGDEAHLSVEPAKDTQGSTIGAVTDTDATAATARLEELSDTIGLPNRLLEAAEVCAATGGVYLRPMWDRDVADHPLLTLVDADRAVPDFRYGQLVAVTFTTVLLEDGDQVWRWLERHEPGVILHGLYVGTASTLGGQRPLTEHPTTAGLDPEVRDHVAAVGQRLLVRYVPNVLPNRKRRRYPIGRADFAGAEPMLDALDEAWSSWMRDLRLGKGRVFVPDEFLQPVGMPPSSERRFGVFSRPGGPGAAKGFDLDTEVLTGLNIADLDQLSGTPLTPVQFAIRVQEHQATCMALVEQIISAGGYSPQTFGLHIEGRAESGTALKLREGKTWRTRARKRRYWKSALADTGENLLALDRAIFGGRAPVIRPGIVWPHDHADPASTGAFVNLLAQAEAASIETRVRLAQPDLDDDAVTAEVARIKAESGSPLPDPFSSGAGRQSVTLTPPAATTDAAAFKVGDRVRVTITNPHAAGQTTGTIAEVNGTTAYGIVFDGMEQMGVHRWYVADELAPAGRTGQPMSM